MQESSQVKRPVPNPSRNPDVPYKQLPSYRDPDVPGVSFKRRDKWSVLTGRRASSMGTASHV